MKGIHLVEVQSESNVEFFSKHARAGCVGLVGGEAFIDKSIRKAQRKVTKDAGFSKYSHAFLFVGPREDGHFYALESDIEFHKERVQIGVQENRVVKYANTKDYPHVAVMDFDLTAAQTRTVLGEGLELMHQRTQYSLRELLAVSWSLKNPFKRQGKNALAQDRALFCSAFVQHCYLKVGIDFSPDVETKLTLPEDLAQTKVAHRLFVRT